MAQAALSLSGPSLSSPRERRPRLLYAEDQATSRIVTTAMLQRMGYDVDAVDDGDVAVDRARTGHYDAILLDIEMPVMDGVTAARTMRAEISALQGTPILALSAFLADSTEHCVWRDAFDRAVPKPANANELQQAISLALTEKRGAKGLAQQHNLTIDCPSLWDSLRSALPAGVRQIMMNAATLEMQHLALSLAAAREAGKDDMLRRCRHSLSGMALNFGVTDLVHVITQTSDTPRALNVSAVFQILEDWQASA